LERAEVTVDSTQAQRELWHKTAGVWANYRSQTSYRLCRYTNTHGHYAHNRAYISINRY